MNELSWFIVRRLLQSIVVVFTVTAIVFVLTRLISDPVALMLPVDASEAQRDTLRQYLGLNQPMHAQFLDFLRSMLTLDFGESYWQHRPNIQIIGERLPATFLLVGASMGLAILLALPLGTVAALYPGRLPDRITSALSLFGLSVPQFWLGLGLIYIFAAQLRWLPSSGPGGVEYLILPGVTLALPAAGRLAMMVRSSLIDELNASYVKTAVAKGMPLSRILGVHAYINAAVPSITIIGWEITRALAGYTIIVETVFAWPGLGLAAIQAIQRQDLLLLQAIVFVVAMMVVAINLALDLLYRFIDPRITV